MKKILSTLLIIIVALLVSLALIKRPDPETKNIKVKSSTEGITVRSIGKP